jgi:hypothetical protein
MIENTLSGVVMGNCKSGISAAEIEALILEKTGIQCKIEIEQLLVAKCILFHSCEYFVFADTHEDLLGINGDYTYITIQSNRNDLYECMLDHFSHGHYIYLFKELEQKLIDFNAGICDFSSLKNYLIKECLQDDLKFNQFTATALDEIIIPIFAYDGRSFTILQPGDEISEMNVFGDSYQVLEESYGITEQVRLCITEKIKNKDYTGNNTVSFIRVSGNSLNMIDIPDWVNIQPLNDVNFNGTLHVYIWSVCKYIPKPGSNWISGTGSHIYINGGTIY